MKVRTPRTIDCYSMIFAVWNVPDPLLRVQFILDDGVILTAYGVPVGNLEEKLKFPSAVTVISSPPFFIRTLPLAPFLEQTHLKYTQTKC